MASSHGVWVELNQTSPGGSVADINIFTEGVPWWEPIVDYFVVSTTPGHSDLYGSLLASLADAGTPMALPLVPGLKPLALFPCDTHSDGNHTTCNLNDLPSWQAYADELSVIIAATGATTIILENETTFFGQSTGDMTIVPDIIRAGIDLFPKDVEYWWYPAVDSFTSIRRERQQEILQIAADVLPNVRFVPVNHSRRKEIFTDFKESAILMTEALVNRRTNSVIYPFINDEQGKWWLTDQVRQVLKYLYSDADVMIYPGRNDFVARGQTFNGLLLHRR